MKSVPVSHPGFINFEMAFGAGHSAQGEGSFSILNTFTAVDGCLA
jgi:hypothetical protein